MTDNDWIKQLQSMMERHEEPVPEDLWQDIKARLPEKQALRRTMPAWRRFAAAAAVALAVIGTGILMWHTSDSTHTTPAEQPSLALTEEDVATVPIVEDYFDANAANYKAAQSKPASTLAHRALSQPQHQSVAQPIEVTQTTPTSENSTTEEPVQTADRDTTTAEPSDPRLPITAKEEPYYASATPNRTAAPPRQRQPITLDLYASNGFNPEQFNRGSKLFASAPPYILSADSIDHGPLHILKREPSQESFSARHHAPYSLGVSIRVPLTDLIALTSGLVYTRVKSDFTVGYSGHYEYDEQILHYLGVPLGATYSLWHYKRFHVYAIGGMQADFNFKATLKKSTQINVEKIQKDRVQFSALAGPGLQFDISQNFGIYFEPTLRYYFNNGSDIENYFKDNPWNINLNAGLRLTLQ